MTEFDKGKLAALEALRTVLDEMKSKGSSPTSNLMNLILDEIFERVKARLR